MENTSKCKEMAELVKGALTVQKLQRLILDGQWHPSHRKNNTGIGKTLEDLLDIKENNNSVGDIVVPMLGMVELKSRRIGSESMVTLFTKSPEPRSVGNRQLLERFGYFKEGSSFKELHFTLSYGDNTIRGKKMVMEIPSFGTDSRINLVDPSEDGGLVVAYYSKKAIEQAAGNKLSLGLILVEAESKFVNGIEYFMFTKATYLCGLDIDAIFQRIKEKVLTLDLRLGTYQSGKNKGKPHDHGNAFRMPDKYLDRIFRTQMSL